ncbi:hypothetical protein [Actinokineospora alba]|uniref:hypothetical protein n=1 Tax=Actinokineospora alba TaxID=504798 RepID=UPI000B83F0CB|nr:hypothetical protein [Actinokineospora alba]
MSEHHGEAIKRHRAARVLAGQATDAADLASLLDMLGLSAAEGLVPPADRPAPVIPPARRSVAERQAARALASTLLGPAGH